MDLKNKTIDELSELYLDKINDIRQAEEEVEKIRLEIKSRDPKFDFMDIFQPIEKQIEMFNQSPYKSEVDDEPIGEYLRGQLLKGKK